MTPTSAETTLAYPIARKADQTDDYFGTKVSDPYRWMEDVDSPELKTWIDAENELTQNYLAQIPVRETMQRRLTELLNFERYTAPSRRGTRYFYSHNSGLQNQNVLYWQEGLTGEPHVLLDPNTFSAISSLTRVSLGGIVLKLRSGFSSVSPIAAFAFFLFFAFFAPFFATVASPSTSVSVSSVCIGVARSAIRKIPATEFTFCSRCTWKRATSNTGIRAKRAIIVR